MGRGGTLTQASAGTLFFGPRLRGTGPEPVAKVGREHDFIQLVVSYQREPRSEQAQQRMLSLIAGVEEERIIAREEAYLQVANLFRPRIYPSRDRVRESYDGACTLIREALDAGPTTLASIETLIDQADDWYLGHAAGDLIESEKKGEEFVQRNLSHRRRTRLCADLRFERNLEQFQQADWVELVSNWVSKLRERDFLDEKTATPVEREQVLEKVLLEQLEAVRERLKRY